MKYATVALFLSVFAAAHPQLHHHKFQRRGFNESATTSTTTELITSTLTTTEFVHGTLSDSSSSTLISASSTQDTTTTLLMTLTSTVTIQRKAKATSSLASSSSSTTEEAGSSSSGVAAAETTSSVATTVANADAKATPTPTSTDDDPAVTLSVAGAERLHRTQITSATPSTFLTSASTTTTTSIDALTTSNPGPTTTRYVTIYEMQTVYRATLTGGQVLATGGANIAHEVVAAAAANTNPVKRDAPASPTLTYHFPTLSKRAYPTGAFGGADAWTEKRRDKRWFGLKEKRCIAYGPGLVGCHDGQVV